MAYGDFNDLTRRTCSKKLLSDKELAIAKILKYAGYQHRLVPISLQFFLLKNCYYACK